MLLAQQHYWPTPIDLLTIALFAVGLLLVVVFGFTFMALDVRRWMRSFRRGLVIVTNYLPGIPRWARTQTPRCLIALGLRLPCKEFDVLRAYREKVKKLHPDRGGDNTRFLRLQENFEQALAFVRQEASAAENEQSSQSGTG